MSDIYYEQLIECKKSIKDKLYLGLRQIKEYEYCLVNSEVQIDVIYNRARRRKVIEFDLRNVQKIAPVGKEPESLNHFEKIYDLTSGIAEREVYEILILKEGKSTQILMEPDACLLKRMSIFVGTKMRRNIS